MEYILEPEQKTKKLKGQDKANIANKIVNDFTSYDNSRSDQLEKANTLINEIYFKNESSKKKDEDDWKSKVNIYKIFMYEQILKAFIWKNTYSSPNSMFDVAGESSESDSNSNKQKTALVDCLEKMDYAKTCDKVIDNSLIYGELISFVTWRKQSEQYRRPISFFEGLKDLSKLPKILAAKAKGDKFYIDEKTIYDNVYIYPVDPANFVFDTSQSDRNWETCPKIYRSWWTANDIIDNEYFEVSKECAEYIKELTVANANESAFSNQHARDLKEKHYNGSTIEVLEHWGDLTLSNGVTLQNWYAVVVAGKYLVRFEKNPFLINPFTYGAYVQDPGNKRGISPLYSLTALSATQEDMLRRTMDLQALNENPPVYAGKGFFGAEPDDIELHPGKIIEYDISLYPDVPVKPMNFDSNVFKDALGYLDDLMSEISGVFPNMAGASESERTTATEISTKVEGQLTRLKMLLDVINQTFILMDIKKMAKLKANFTFGEETVFVDNENNPKDVVIDDNIRQAEYRYTYSDRSATSERFNYADMVAQSIQMFAKAGTAINTSEVFTWYMEQKGVENPERFLMQQDMLAPEVQQALMQNPQLAPVIQEMQRRVEMAKNGEALPDEGESENEEAFLPQAPEGDPTFEETLGSLPGRNLLSR